jgi:cell division protein FtsL
MKSAVRSTTTLRPSWKAWLGTQLVRPRRIPVAVERKLIFKILLVVVLYGVSATAYIWIHLQNTSMGYVLASLNRTHEDLVQRKNELQIEWEMLRAPQRIAAIAEHHLGMVPPDPHDVVIVK